MARGRPLPSGSRAWPFIHPPSRTPTTHFCRGGAFLFSFAVPSGYPHDPPKVKCLTKVYHPNIDLEVGAGCHGGSPRRTQRWCCPQPTQRASLGAESAGRVRRPAASLRVCGISRRLLTPPIEEKIPPPCPAAGQHLPQHPA